MKNSGAVQKEIEVISKRLSINKFKKSKTNYDRDLLVNHKRDKLISHCHLVKHKICINIKIYKVNLQLL
jgi:hypothetical protein